MAFIAWTDIEAFYNIRKYTHAHPEILGENPIVTYKCKVKLHGTNSAIQVFQDGRVVAQSRTKEITPEDDNAGFARWVNNNEYLWASLSDNADEDIIIFGEWIGKGIQSGVAVSEIPKKSFAVFAARILTDEDSLITEPYLLQDLVKGIPDTYVLPWHNTEIEIDWSKPAEELTVITDKINQWVNEVEKIDPWVENTFGVKGTGEGLVFYPASHKGHENFKNLCFKAKGEAHKNIKTAAPAQVDPEKAASVDQFVELVLTEARLEQGAAGSYDMKQMGKFINWIVADVKKETQDELEASNLTWDQVTKALTTKARTWYMQKAQS
jgi:hypothetical protein